MRLLLLGLLIAMSAGTAGADPVHHAGAGEPVVLVAGPEADENLYAWPDGGGLAPFLARRGFSVWIAAGDDIGGAIDHVIAAEGSEQVSLVGHGLGGTAIYRYLTQAGDEPPIHAVVVIGAPVGLAETSPLREAVFEAAAQGVPRWSLLAFEPSPLAHAGEDLFAAAMTARPDDTDIWRRAREAGALTSSPAMGDLEGWIAGAAELPAVEFPVLTVCGEKDRMAPCEEAWQAREQLGGTFHKVGYMNLDGGDFGHLDLMLSDRARKHVFGVVKRFLERGETR